MDFFILSHLNLTFLYLLLDAIIALTGRPLGTFIIRPHEVKDETYLCFLSFVGTAQEVSGMEWCSGVV